MGDMNIDLLKYHEQSKTNMFTDSLFSSSFIPLITIPTRVSYSSATLLDHIYTNHISPNASSGVVITDLADHYGVFYIANKKKNKESARNSPIRKRIFSKSNMQNLKSISTSLNLTFYLVID